MNRRSSRISNTQPTIIAEEDESELSELESSSEELVEKSLVIQKKSIIRSNQSTGKKIQDIHDSSSNESSSEEEEEEEDSELESSDEDDNEYGKRKKKTLPRNKKKPLNKKARMISPSPSLELEIQEPKVFVPGPINSIPGDIFYEICRSLNPKGLFALYRCSRLFRQYLLSNKSLWTLSRNLYGLPDLSVRAIEEHQYVSLVFGTNCQSCGVGGVGFADFYLRIRMCPKCTKLNWVNLQSFCKGKPELHPDTLKCVMASPRHKPGYHRFWGTPDFSSCTFGIYSDVYKYDAILQDLELEDHVAQNERSRGSGRRSLGEVAQKSVKSESLVEAFVRERVTFLKAIFDQGVTLTTSVNIAIELEEDTIRAGARAIARKRETAALEHQSEIETKLREADRSVNDILIYRQIITGQIGFALTAASNFESTTDQVWEKVKSHLLRLIPARVSLPLPPAVVKTEDKSESQESASSPLQNFFNTPAVQARNRWDLEREGRSNLREQYQILRNSGATEVEKTTFPLLGDFLQLPSMKNFLGPDNNWSFVQTEWDNKLDSIKEEVEKYRIAVRIHAIKTILAATTLETYEELSKHDDDYFDEVKFDENFFNNPTHFLVCNFWGCNQHQGMAWLNGRRVFTLGRNTQFSSLNDLLEHQHLHHSDQSSRHKYCLGHFHLPDPVVFALSGIVDVGQLDDDTVTIAELDNIGENLQWSNSYASKKLYDWRNLIEKVVSKHRSATKNNPVPIPTISLVLPRKSGKPQNGRRRRR